MNRIDSRLFFSMAIILLPLLSHYAYGAPSIRDYGSLPTVSMMSVSPSGKLAAFRRVSDGRDLVLVVSLNENKVLTGVDVASIKPRDLYFIDEDQLILVASKVRKISGFKGIHDISTAYLMDVVTGNIRQLLTPGDVIYAGQLGLGHIVGISVDGDFAYMPAYVAKSATDQSPDKSLMRVSLRSKRSPSVYEKGSSDTVDYFVDAESNALVKEIYNNRTNVHRILVRKDREWGEIFREQVEVPEISIVGLTPDRKSLVVLIEPKDIGRVSYFTMSLVDGVLSKPIFGREDADVASVLTDIQRVVYGVRYTGFRPDYSFFDKSIDQRMADISGWFPGHSVWLVSWSPDWKHLAVYVEGQEIAGDYYLFSENQRPRFLTNSRPQIQVENIHPVAELKYKARDGLTIPTLLTIPRNRLESLQKLPAVMLPHGGPEAHDVIGFDWLPQALASRGYLVIQPQFRGSDGFGTQHKLAGRGEWGKKMQDDLTDGVDYLVKEGIVDPQRVCIAGVSYGGYAALAGGAFTPDYYKCVISIAGVSDLRRMIRDDKSEHGKDHWVISYWERVIAKGETDNKFLDDISPVNFAQNFKAPVLLIHGTHDKVVPVEQSRLMQKQLQRAKEEVEFVVLKREDHYLSDSETRVATLDAVVKFVDKHIGASP
jgi:dipeptidyl aminopeptidase/acylaminoacyl peptidase